MRRLRNISREHLHLQKKIGDRYVEASAYGKLETVFQSLGEYAKAKEHLEIALALTKEIGDKKGEV